MQTTDQEFEILVSTSGKFAAGTDAKVFIKLFGSDGESDEIELIDNTKGKRLFEAGSDDKFTVKVGKAIGIITKIAVRHDDSGHFSGWHLNKVTIKDITTSRNYNFHCNRWLAKDEGDKKIAIEIENLALQIVKVDQKDEKNRPLHNTIKFISKQLIVRRGQTFFIDVHLTRPYKPEEDNFYISLKTGNKPREFDKSFVHIPKVEEFDALNQKWAYKVIGMKENILNLEVNCPVDALPAKYEIAFEDDDYILYQHPNSLFILFNPWNKADDVFMKDDEDRREYVLRQHGVIYTGSSKYQSGKDWYFGQFEDVSLECTFYLLSLTKPSGRDSVIEVTRRMSSLVNSCDNRGLLVGNWSGDYEGGKSPLYWTSSPPIFEEYMKEKKSVKFGQCWVFSALLTTVLRTLGIPCRSVTNFNSAHDTNANVSKDIYLDEDGKQIDGMTSDSIWNFHCWNDAWMARPDLKPGYGGWQAVDATPQERSEGKYQCGPCSLKAIKEGEVDFPHDGKFILAEVNSDVLYHQKDENGKWEVVRANRTHVGKKISTKIVGKRSRQDITNEYKFPENSVLERATVRRAMDKAGNMHVRSTPKTLEMKARPQESNIEIGDDINVDVFLKNTGEQDLTLKLIVGGNIVRYNGVSKGELGYKRLNEKIGAQEEKKITVNLKASGYMGHLNEYSMIRLFITCTAKETRQVCTTSKIVEIRKPELVFRDVPSEVELDKEVTLKVQFANPLDVALQNGMIHLDGTLMKERISAEFRNIGGKKSSELAIKITPNTKPGTRSLLATFSSKQLAGLHASLNFKVV
ncbi:coagulation factor XIII A chain-like [Rhopilema esculentum]|uniref:coagulation factor XIII A chain-like n=1 Tax=Rhopilema esculentum TaxID=499914 RepID=UPI0031E1B272|eukprot:gene9083-16737_t